MKEKCYVTESKMIATGECWNCGCCRPVSNVVVVDGGAGEG
jgi:hypothetical protein